MHPLTTTLLNLLSALPDAAVVVVNPTDYHLHLISDLKDRLIPATNQATVAAGCVGHISHGEGRLAALYLRSSVPLGEVRAGTVAVLKESQR